MAKLETYYSDLRDDFVRIDDGSLGPISEVYRIGSETVAVKYATRDLHRKIAQSLRPLLCSESVSAHLTVFVYDAKLAPWPSGIQELFEDLAASQQGSAPRSQLPVYYYRDDRYTVVFNRQKDLGELTVLDRMNDEAIVSLLHSDENLVSTYAHAPFRNLFTFWLEDRGYLVLHAAAVGTLDGGVLIAGNNGAGKSTVSLSCLGSELMFAGDDSILTKVGKAPYAHMLYATASVWLKDLENYPLLRKVPYVERKDAPKGNFFLDGLGKHTLAEFPVRAIVMTRFSSDDHASLSPITAQQVLMSLAPGSLSRMPGDVKKCFERIVFLAKSVPCYLLTLGKNNSVIPNILFSLLGDLSGNAVRKYV